MVYIYHFIHNTYIFLPIVDQLLRFSECEHHVVNSERNNYIVHYNHNSFRRMNINYNALARRRCKY